MYEHPRAALGKGTYRKSQSSISNVRVSLREKRTYGDRGTGSSVPWGSIWSLGCGLKPIFSPYLSIYM
jgi:hypothetical protein